MLSIKSLSVVAIISILSTACGGGSGGGSGSGNGTSTPEPEKFVDGQFKQASVTGQKFPQGTETDNICETNSDDKYFESANVLVYSNSRNLPNTDYQYIATAVEVLMPVVAASMSITIDDIWKYRPGYTPAAASLVTQRAVDDKDMGYEILKTDPEFYLTNDGGVKLALIKRSWNSLSDEDQGNVVKVYNDFYQQFSLNLDNHKLPQKIIVCLDDRREDNRFYGEGHLLGISIAPRSVNNRKDAYEVITHELVHTIQSNLAAPMDSLFTIDRWFLEGQAVFVANQKIAKGHKGYNPVHVHNIFDEKQEANFYPYEHYGLAYDYLTKSNSDKDLSNVLLSVRNYSGSTIEDTLNSASSSFKFAFFMNLKKADATPLILEEFKDQYFNWVKE